ncbi:MAG: hypothetical protein JO020_19195 [Chloroflexi bacterium]|nr:hypothetical protein [Chloroflexota bacterium]
MSERRRADTAEANAADLQAQVDAVADVLYGLSPDEFSPSRDEYIRQAREQKNQPLARELATLRKPTQSAWLINQLWRDQHDVMEQLFELANELTRAQAQAAGSALRELTQQRRQLENALLQQAIGLARQKGVHVSDSVAREAQETLGAALALPEVADEVRSGRLVKPASYAGFGAPTGTTPTPAQPRREPIDLAAIQRARAAQAERKSAAPAKTGPEAEDVDEIRRAEEEEAARRAREDEERRRAAAERRLQEARAAMSAAEAEVARAERALSTAEQRQADLRQQSETLRDQLRRVEAAAEEADREATEARRLQRRAESERVDAADAVEQAERALRQ